MEKNIRMCGLYCPHFSDVLVEFFCNYKERENVVFGGVCKYGLREVSEEQKAEAESKLEKDIEFQRMVRENPEKIGSCNLRIIT